MTIYKYLQKYLRGLILMLLIFNYSYSMDFSNQKYLPGTIENFSDEKYYGIMPENDWKEKGLKGKVKIMTETIYSYGYSSEDDEAKKIVTKFNENGYIIEELHYNKDSKETFSNNYKYNKQGLLIESDEYDYSYEYDKERNLVQIKKQKYGVYRQIEKITYDKEGRIIRERYYTQSEHTKKGVKELDDDSYIKDEEQGLFQLLSDNSYIYNNNGGLEEIRDNIHPSGSIKYSYEYENRLDIKIVETSTQKIITYYDESGNELYYIWITLPTSDFEAVIQLYLIFKDTKRDKYGNLIYQVANRMEAEDITIGKGIEKGIYEKKVIEYEYYN